MFRRPWKYLFERDIRDEMVDFEVKDNFNTLMYNFDQATEMQKDLLSEFTIYENLET